MTDDDLIAKYAAEAKQSLDAEANKRIQETVDPIREAKLRKMSLFDILDSEELVPALLSRLGSVRAALDGHGGGIKVDSHSVFESDGKSTLEMVLDLTEPVCHAAQHPELLTASRQIWRLIQKSKKYAFLENCWTHLMSWGENLF